MILLVGLIVKNGILLLDARAPRARTPARRRPTALAHAGRVRLRPILMTTVCTLAGLVPLALGLGAGAELQRPLALAVIGGLVVSTLVTLLIVPVLLEVFGELEGRRRSAIRDWPDMQMLEPWRRRSERRAPRTSIPLIMRSRPPAASLLGGLSSPWPLVVAPTVAQRPPAPVTTSSVTSRSAVTGAGTTSPWTRPATGCSSPARRG